MNRLTGNKAEESAANYLKKQGYKILHRNVTYPFGEIDIVAQNKDALVFVEVKHRNNEDFGEPYEWVTKAKQRKIIKAAHAYLNKLEHLPADIRFDVISLVGFGDESSLDHIEDAFCEEEII